MIIERIESRGYSLLPEKTDCVWDFPTSLYIIDLGSKVLLCDTHTGPGCISRVKSFVLKELGKREFIVFNSHAHWDHVAGNCAFSDDTVILSSEITFGIIRECMECQFSANSEYLEDNVKLRLPNLLFSERLIFPEYGLEFFLAPGHTPGCSCCLDTRDNVLFAGDIIESPIPSFDYYRTDIYAKTLESLLKARYSHIMTSHSGRVKRELIQDNLNYVNSFMNTADSAIFLEKYGEAHINNLKMLKISCYEEKWREILKDSFSFSKFFSIIDFSRSPEEIENQLKHLIPESISKNS